MSELPTLLYTFDEAQEVLRVSRSQLYRLIKDEGLPVVRFGKRKRLINKAALRTWLEERTEVAS